MTKILVLDDEPIVRMLMTEILEAAGHEVSPSTCATDALQLLAREEFDLVVSDVMMPDLSGLDLLAAVREVRAAVPVLLVTGAGTYDTLSQALTRGAAGLVQKPFSHGELRDAVSHALDRAAASRDELRARLLAPTLASALANAIEARDNELHGHCERLAALAVRLAEVLGLSGEAVDTIRLGATLHDIGKIGIPDRVLLKPGALDPDEWQIMTTHTEIGDRLLEPLELLDDARPIVRHHHERWDGGGYPDGLAGEEIPIGARIVSVADAVEAMSSRKLYATPRSQDEIIVELRACRGHQWDPQVVDAVFSLLASGELVLRTDGLLLFGTDEAARV